MQVSPTFFPALNAVLNDMLFGLKPTDVVTYVSAALGLTVIAILAGYLPAKRAARVDPLVALRYE